MAEATSSSATAQARLEPILTRNLGAPRGLVFRAWTDPQHLARWWGPRGFTNPVCELDVRPRPHAHRHARASQHDLSNERRFSRNRRASAPGLKSATADREMVIARVINAPRALVFEAWTKPEDIGNWWAPRGFATTTHSMDVRPGGEWRFVMHGPDGTDYKNKIVYLEVVEPERLVYHFGEEGDEEEKFQTIVTSGDRGTTTEVIMRALFPTAATREFVAEKHGAIEGGKQTLERLAEFVGSGSVKN